jgi:hypothetical protein
MHYPADFISATGIDLFQLSIIIIGEVKSSMDVLGLTEKKQDGGV